MCVVPEVLIQVRLRENIEFTPQTESTIGATKTIFNTHKTLDKRAHPCYSVSMMTKKPSPQFRFSPGDLVKFHNGIPFGEVGLHDLGLIIRRDFTDAREPAVLITFPHASGQEYHYYDLELTDWEVAGSIEVHRA